MKNYEVYGIEKISAMPQEIVDGPNMALKFKSFKSAEAFADWLNQEAHEWVK
jgi:hypothetical protein